MAKQVEIRGLDELSKRMKDYPVRYAKVVSKTVTAALMVLWEKVFPYPPPPTGRRYRRTGLGVSQTGGKMGQPDIFTVKKLGMSNFIGRFGTMLGYAGRVIGDRSQQSAFFSQYWWRLEQVTGRAYGKIKGLFDIATKELAKFLEGKGL